MFLMCGSPLSFWFFLPFIRGEGTRETNYDLFQQCGPDRLGGVCGRASKAREEKLGELGESILDEPAAAAAATAADVETI